MGDETRRFMIDVLDKINSNETLSKQMNILHISSVLDDLTIQEYKSIFFLLMDHVNENEFLNVTKQEKIYLKQRLEEILQTINDSVLIELFGTLKMYEKLRMLGSCQHVYKDAEQKKLKIIDELWIMLYSLCEELTDVDLEDFKLVFPDDVRKQITTAEDWFYWALKKKLFSKTDFSKLETIFQNYPNCLDIIKNFVKPKSYDIRTPTASINCGIAVIFNFVKFTEPFPERRGSSIDANSLEAVWNSFGFETYIHVNMTFDETVEKLEYYAKFDHSDFDAFVCCILSHGVSNSIITADGEEMPISFLISKITNTCITLNSKPKLFFIQACQGINVHQGVGKAMYEFKQPQRATSNKIDFSTPPIAIDVLLAISTLNGFVSFRNSETGSWFIHALCTILEKKGDKFSILDVMIEVNDMVRRKVYDFGPGKARHAFQIVNCHNTFAKILILKKRIE